VYILRVISRGKACWKWYDRLKEIGAEWGLDEIFFSIFFFLFFFFFSPNLVFKNSPKSHSASSHHCWENTLLTFRISMWTHSWAGTCYVGYSEVKYMKSIKGSYLIMVCLEMSTEQPTAAHLHNQKWKQGYLHEISGSYNSDCAVRHLLVW